VHPAQEPTATRLQEHYLPEKRRPQRRATPLLDGRQDTRML
jgi:hypothetical protein